ncbi:mammalian cell entry protein [Picosynechococcus sp. PCC 7003]|uniref:MlaD family protein n=1 Tax=Picosynechococcus sp. PCC 7003 TaxID=374981 RepID=UPI00081040DB|nr:MlaD family protein [Picosynechococcus sp. PCC 7003]ANV85319.1 mammalian cell entry protein [Picosynechococcus sp. PCC 7003]
MRSRTLKEGSLGLFIFAGLSLLGVVLIWLTGATLGKRTYSINVRFDNANAMQEGAIVRYRGIEVGRIVAVQPSSNGIEIKIQIQTPDLVIPRDVVVEANQGGLIGETSLEIIPQTELTQAEMAQSPFADDCPEKSTILCDGTTLDGVIGVSFDQVLRNTTKFSELYGDPEFFEIVRTLADNSSDAAAQVAILTEELALLSKEVRGEVDNFAENAQAITDAAVTSSNQLNRTLEQVNTLTGNFNSLVVENRQALVGTLNSIGRTSDQMQRTLASFDTTLDTVNQNLSAANTQEILDNLTVLTANAATTSENLKDVSTALNDPTNVLMLQKTLDAARVTFENTQKITADLDELTGDPQFRRNLIDLVNGLSQLVSSTDQLQQQIQVANRIEQQRPIYNQQRQLSLRPKSQNPDQSQPKN